MSYRHTALYGNFISFVCHLGFLLILASFVLPNSPVGSANGLLTATIDADSSIPNDGSFELMEITVDTVKFDEEMQAIELAEETIAAIEPTIDISTPDLMLAPTMDSEANKVDEIQSLNSEGPESRSGTSRTSKNLRKRLETASRKGTNITEPLITAPSEGIVHSNTVEAATSELLGGLKQGITKDGITKIIWLMDASLSLKEEREILAPQVEQFYGQLLREQQSLKEQDASLRLNSIVFAFGATLFPVRMDRGEVTPEAISRGIKNLPIDETGIENVMTALISALGNVASGRNERIEVVIWTDESGNDLHLLEDAISLCRSLKARVHIVGPLSVMGMRDGTQQFTLPKPWEYRVELPVMRGPDSAFPERAQLPMWFDSNADGWEDGPVVLASESGDLGGPHRRKLLAPTGPYALTRLALATGGRFVVLQRQGDRASIQGDRYKEYLPDYGSGLQILSDIQNKPLRAAVVEAAAITDANIYTPPSYVYPTSVLDYYPYARSAYFVEPAIFPQVLEQQLSLRTSKLIKARRVVQEAIDVMLMRRKLPSISRSAIEVARVETADSLLNETSIPYEYEYEKSPRWRAWYDLNLGRLLYQSVRIDSFLSVANELTSSEVVKSMMLEEHNFVRLSPSELSTSSGDVKARAKLGRYLLERVKKDHPDTPWSQLAIWELEHATGFAYEFGRLPRPRPVFQSVPMVRSNSSAPVIPRL